MKTLACLLLLSSLTFASTHHVPKDFVSIQSAIDASSAGDRILVSAGTYPERIALKPHVTLRSAGDDQMGASGLRRAERTILDGGVVGEGPGVRMAEASTLDGFTVTRVGAYDAEAWRKAHATQGENQSHEHIGEFGTPGIGVEDVTCMIRNNIVHHNGFTGIALSGANNESRVHNNTCFRNMGGGIGLMDGSKSEVRGNTCYENYYAGIGHDDSDPLIIDNDCYLNIRAGIGISHGASPTVVSNRCYQNRRAGIGIRTDPDTQPIVQANECYLNDMAGIGVRERAAPELIGNHCYSNKLAGIGVRLDATPTIYKNLIHSNGLVGIGLASTENGLAKITGNRVSDHKMPALSIQSGWKVVANDNVLERSEGLPPVVMVFAGAEVSFARNKFMGPGVAGVRVAGTATFRTNTFDGVTVRKRGPPHYGIWVLDGGIIDENGGDVFRNWREDIHR
ncbi:MAG: parallel beta-helix repeat protein [Kiritimatiellia bacterium]|jgi:parallel beta-helix repeat protein